MLTHQTLPAEASEERRQRLAATAKERVRRGEINPELIRAVPPLLRVCKALVFDIEAATPNNAVVYDSKWRESWIDYLKNATTIDDIRGVTIRLSNQFTVDWVRKNFDYRLWNNKINAATTGKELYRAIMDLDGAILFYVNSVGPMSPARVDMGTNGAGLRGGDGVIAFRCGNSILVPGCHYFDTKNPSYTVTPLRTSEMGLEAQIVRPREQARNTRMYSIAAVGNLVLIPGGSPVTPPVAEPTFASLRKVLRAAALVDKRHGRRKRCGTCSDYEGYNDEHAHGAGAATVPVTPEELAWAKSLLFDILQVVCDSSETYKEGSIMRETRANLRVARSAGDIQKTLLSIIKCLRPSIDGSWPTRLGQTASNQTAKGDVLAMVLELDRTIEYGRLNELFATRKRQVRHEDIAAQYLRRMRHGKEWPIPRGPNFQTQYTDTPFAAAAKILALCLCANIPDSALNLVLYSRQRLTEKFKAARNEAEVAKNLYGLVRMIKASAWKKGFSVAEFETEIKRIGWSGRAVKAETEPGRWARSVGGDSEKLILDLCVEIDKNLLEAGEENEDMDVEGDGGADGKQGQGGDDDNKDDDEDEDDDEDDDDRPHQRIPQKPSDGSHFRYSQGCDLYRDIPAWTFDWIQYVPTEMKVHRNDIVELQRGPAGEYGVWLLVRVGEGRGARSVAYLLDLRSGKPGVVELSAIAGTNRPANSDELSRLEAWRTKLRDETFTPEKIRPENPIPRGQKRRRMYGLGPVAPTRRSRRYYDGSGSGEGGRRSRYSRRDSSTVTMRRLRARAQNFATHCADLIRENSELRARLARLSSQPNPDAIEPAASSSEPPVQGAGAAEMAVDLSSGGAAKENSNNNDGESSAVDALDGVDARAVIMCGRTKRGVELLTLIASFLDIKERSRCARVCSLWSTPILNLKVNLIDFAQMRRSVTDRILLSVASRHGDVDTLCLEGCEKLTDSALCSVVQHYAHEIAFVNVSYCPALTDRTLTFLQGCRNLKTLVILGCNFSAKGLEELDNSIRGLRVFPALS